MRHLASVILVLSIAACERGVPRDPPAPRTSPVSPGAPQNLAVPDEVRVKLDISAARTAIQLYQQQAGSWPPSLAALNLKLHYPNDMKYDAATGQLSSLTYPAY